MNKKHILFLVMSIGVILFTFGGKLIKAEEIDLEEQKSLINKIISLHSYEGDLEEEFKKIKEDKDRTAL